MWIILSILASLFWGLTYVFDEKIYQKISVLTALAISSFIAFVTLTITTLITGSLKEDLNKITSDNNLLLLVILCSATLIIAELFIGFSISAKNATLAGLIEISYPVFIALFTYLIFKENHISWSVFFGGVLVFSGIFVIYTFNK